VNNGGKYAAFSASCSHACCIVKVKGSELYCNCHGATYNLSTGAVTGGPASSPLDVLQVCSDATGVTVTW
jgi:Rieske Fe-S protein